MTNLKFLEFSGHFDRVFPCLSRKEEKKNTPGGRRHQFIIGTVDGVKDTFRLPKLIPQISMENPYPPNTTPPPKKKHLQLWL